MLRNVHEHIKASVSERTLVKLYLIFQDSPCHEKSWNCSLSRCWGVKNLGLDLEGVLFIGALHGHNGHRDANRLERNEVN